MFADYQKQVLLAYHEMKADHALSPNLIHTTPAKLRDECLLVFHERYDHHDDGKTLRMFFGPRDDASDYERVIRNFGVDKFRPLVHLLKGETSETQEKNIELLAWLIGFKPRPYQWGRSYPAAKQQMEILHETSIDTAEGGPGVKGAERDTKGSALLPPGSNLLKTEIRQRMDPVAERPDVKPGIALLRKARDAGRSKLALLLLLCISGGGLFIFWKAKAVPEQCMCWAGDHYRAVSCREKPDGADVFGLDSLRIAGFRKIMRPDTLTQRSLGHVWYSKIDGIVEFYTSGGFHPVHREKKLKPLTVYILNKYAAPANAAGISGN